MTYILQERLGKYTYEVRKKAIRNTSSKGPKEIRCGID